MSNFKVGDRVYVRSFGSIPTGSVILTKHTMMGLGTIFDEIDEDGDYTVLGYDFVKDEPINQFVNEAYLISADLYPGSVEPGDYVEVDPRIYGLDQSPDQKYWRIARPYTLGLTIEIGNGTPAYLSFFHSMIKTHIKGGDYSPEYSDAVPLGDIDTDTVFYADGKEWTISDPDNWEGKVTVKAVYDDEETVMTHDRIVMINKKEDAQ